MLPTSHKGTIKEVPFVLAFVYRSDIVISMPAKNSIKQFVANSYYHLYNRGVEKRIICIDEQDYAVLLSYLQTYLLPRDDQALQKIILSDTRSYHEKNQAARLLNMNNFSSSVELVAFCLMPNHFHFLVKQKNENDIDRFMNSLFTRYSMYFNRRYKRVGPLFQGLYKAVIMANDEQLLHLTRYIHRNPLQKGSALRGYVYSSYPVYLELQKTEWVHPESILSFFRKSNKTSYESFVEDISLNEGSISFLGASSIDPDEV